MKKTTIFITILLGLASPVFAATGFEVGGESKIQKIQYSTSDVIGIRIGLQKSDLRLKISERGTTVSGKLEQDFGLSLGYENISSQNFGFLGAISFTSYDNDKYQSVRLDANGTYGFGNKLYGFLGANWNDYIKNSDGIDPGIGYQLGLGYQATRNFGVSLAYLVLNNSLDYNFEPWSSGTIDIETKGLELSLNLTF